MQKAPRTATAKVRNRAGPGRLFAIACAALIALLPSCKENLSAPPTGLGPDTTGPLVQLHPAQDTLVDSTGILLVRVDASDRSGVESVTFVVLPTVVAPSTLTGSDTALGAFFPIVLGSHKHSTFKYFVQAGDILGHETVSDTVTVTVK